MENINMSRTDKDNKHILKHKKSYKCPERDCTYCNARAKESRHTREERAMREEIES